MARLDKNLLGRYEEFKVRNLKYLMLRDSRMKQTTMMGQENLLTKLWVGQGMLEKKELWEDICENETLKFEQKLTYLKKKKKTKSKKKIDQLPEECMHILNTLLDDWTRTKSQDEELLEMRMRRDILKTREVVKGTEKKDVTEDEPAAAIHDQGRRAFDKLRTSKIFGNEDVVADKEVKFETVVVEDIKEVITIDKKTKPKIIQVKKSQGLRTPLKQNKLMKKMTTPSPFGVKRTKISVKMKCTPPKKFMTLKSCKEQGPSVKQIVQMFEEGQQMHCTRTIHKSKMQNDFITKPLIISNSSLESRSPNESTTRLASQSEESTDLALIQTSGHLGLGH